MVEIINKAKLRDFFYFLLKNQILLICFVFSFFFFQSSEAKHKWNLSLHLVDFIIVVSTYCFKKIQRKALDRGREKEE